MNNPTDHDFFEDYPEAFAAGSGGFSGSDGSSSSSGSSDSSSGSSSAPSSSGSSSDSSSSGSGSSSESSSDSSGSSASSSSSHSSSSSYSSSSSGSASSSNSSSSSSSSSSCDCDENPCCGASATASVGDFEPMPECTVSSSYQEEPAKTTSSLSVDWSDPCCTSEEPSIGWSITKVETRKSASDNWSNVSNYEPYVWIDDPNASSTTLNANFGGAGFWRVSVSVSVNWYDSAGGGGCDCTETDSGEALATIVGIDRIIQADSDPENNGPINVVIDESIDLEAIPCPEEEDFPSGNPMWTLEDKPEESQLPGSLGTGPSISFRPDVDGSYSIKAKCCDSEQTITVNAHDCSPECDCCDSDNFSSEPVHYGTGALRLSSTDISMTGFGQSWGHTRVYSNRLSGLSDTNGDRWMIRQCAKLTRPNGDDSVVIIAVGPRQRYVFDNFVSRNNGRRLLQKVSAGYQMIEANGTVWEFHDYIQNAAPQGQLKQVTPPGGQAPLDYTYDGDGRLDYVQRTASSVTQKIDYTYNADDRIEQITLTRKVGPAAAVNVRRATYTYTGSLLQQVDLEYFDGGWESAGSHYYRYHSDGDQLLKLVLEPAGYAKAESDLDSQGGVAAALDDDLLPYARYEFSYDDQGRVSSEKVEGGARTYGFTYEPITSSADLADFNKWYYKAVETLPDGTTNTVYSNIQGQQLLKEYTAGTKHWIDYKVYDGNGYLTQQWTPAAVHNYSVLGNTLNVNPTANGLIQVTEYPISTTAGPNTAGDVLNYPKAQKIRRGDTGTEVTLSETKYFVHTDANGREIYPVAEQTVYQGEGETNPTTTRYEYQWHGNTAQMKQRETIMPAVPASQHGGDVENSTLEYYDEYGNQIWQQGARGYVRHQVFEQTLGVMTQSIEDVDASLLTLPNGWSAAAGGKHLVTDYEYDDESRLTQTLGPVHKAMGEGGGSEIDLRRATWTIYRSDYETWTAQGYQRASDDSLVLVNPVSINRRSVDGTVSDSIVAEYDGLSTLPNPANYDFDEQDNWFRWSSQHSNLFGRQTSSRVYHTIPATADQRGSSGVHFDETVYGYDGLSRQDRMVTPGGTITRTVFDDRGRAVSTWIGTDDNNGAWNPSNTAGSNLVKVSQQQYDNDGGGGNGLVTQQIQYVDANSANERVTQLQYDWQNRLERTYLPTDAQGRTVYSQQVYDNAGRVIQSQTYLENLSGGDELLSQDETKYDDRGRAYQQIRYAVANGVAGNKLIDRTWYDCCGNVIKQKTGGGQLFTKTVYDSLARAVNIYMGVDTAEVDTDYDAAFTLDGDTIYEQSETLYDEAGNVIAETALSRYHAGTGTGELVAGTNARTNHSATWYDSLGRSVVSGNYGNLGDDSVSFDRSTLSRPSLYDSDVIASETQYNEAGEADIALDSNGRKHVTEYDDAGRVVRSIQNYVGTTGDPRTGSDSENITVDTTYTADGQVSTLTALQKTPADDQVTRYVYGTGEGNATPLVYRNDLLRAEIYPDSDNSASPLADGPSGYDRIEYEYNRQGQIISKKDQNRTVHVYTFDRMGRQLSDEVTTLGADIDDSVDKISTTYEKRGLVETITSSKGTAVVNQVKRSYNGLAQLTSEKQSIAGEVTSATSAVEYGYDLTSASGEFTKGLRPTTLTYPDGREIEYSYLGNLNRVSGISENGSGFVGYSYMGLQSHVGVSLSPLPIAHHLDLNNDNTYAGLDRFGRVIEHQWYKWSKVVPNFPIVQLRHGYDNASNRLYREDVAADSKGAAFDELYTYDQTNRLTDFQSGNLAANKTSITGQTLGQHWGLDPLGNWDTYDQTVANPVSQTRTHSRANEIDTISDWHHPVHDRAGNMTEIPEPYNPGSQLIAKYDAWNRLAYAEAGGHRFYIYQYDGLNRRTSRSETGVLTQFYHSARWQVLQENIISSQVDEQRQYVWGTRYVDDLILRDSSFSTGAYQSSGSSSSGGQISERLYALQDANFNVVALVDETSQVVERYAYTPYGEVTYLDRDFTPLLEQESAFENEYLYTGRRVDRDSGLQLNRNRYYHQQLGRWVSRDPIGYEGGINLYAMYFVPNGVDPLGLQGAPNPGVWRTGPEAGIISYIADFQPSGPGGADINRVLELWSQMTGKSPKPGTPHLLSIALNELSISANDAPPRRLAAAGEWQAFKDSKEYRGYLFFRPAIKCCTNNQGNQTIVDHEVRDLEISHGYTPIRGSRDGTTLHHEPGEGQSNVKTRTFKAFGTECTEFNYYHQFRVGGLGQTIAKVLTGLAVPWAWHRITHTVCCNGKWTIDYSGSHFPSHAAYIVKVKVGTRNQSDLAGALLANGAVLPGEKFHTESR